MWQAAQVRADGVVRAGVVGLVVVGPGGRVAEVAVDRPADRQQALGIELRVVRARQEAEAAHEVGFEEEADLAQDPDLRLFQGDQPAVRQDRRALVGVVEPLSAAPSPTVFPVLR